MSPVTSTVTVVLLSVALVVCSFWLLRELRARNALYRWLVEGRKGDLPDGHGVWRTMYVAEEQLLKTQRREMTLINHRLERYFTAAQVLHDGIVLLDAGTRIEWMNAAAGEHLGIDFTKDHGTQIAQLLRKPQFQNYLRRFMSDADAPADGVELTMGEDERHLRLHLLRFSAEGVLLVSRDVTAMVRTEKMRSDFIANVSHELRTPATVISGFLEQLTSDEPPPPEVGQHFLSLMSEQAQRMNRLVEDLLMLTRLESDTRAQRDDVIDVPALVSTLIDEGRALSSGRHDVVCGAIDAVSVRGSADEIRSAFGNLISNAIRYTPEGGRIEVSWKRSERDICLSVMDSGIGIAPEHIPRLTERFYRVDRGRSTATGGTGLGLAIVKHALSRHQGKLKIQSGLGRGSTFCACLPLERIAA
jgi:two-component system, OmpR family, phosphate regulon sensor histidine kinase PhoR